ncbi:hypothetical protein ACFSC3_00915 [Sphingomonas floccifaciens]|uniref:Uncharacterized protein n=1 Tax=Sphingomonas floccifaciens TaxID=1844115 RepID=A0ABW4N7K5_9SPHN
MMRQHHHRSPRRSVMLDERTCAMICPVSAGLVGACMTAIGIIQVLVRRQRIGTIADDLLSFDALLFLAASLSAYFALRVQSQTRLHWLERLADAAFIAAMLLLTVSCFVLTYWMER